MGSIPVTHGAPGEEVTVFGVSSPQSHVYSWAVRVTVTSLPSKVTVWVWVG